MSSTDCLYKIPITLKEPIEKDGRYTYQISVPCGKCTRCIMRRKMEWSFRMTEEMKQSKTAYFITLTYSNETIPINKYGRMTLMPEHLQLFFKRLRQNQKRTFKSYKKHTLEHIRNNLQPEDKIKYYAAGEYGTDRGRPHYHAIIYNTSRRTIEKSWKTREGKEIGYTQIVPANEATIQYVMKYLDKRLLTKQDWKKEPEFNTMSEEIGTSYIDRNREFHKRNLDVLYVTNDKGIRIPMPRYYRLKIFTDDERKEQVLNVENILTTIRDESIVQYGYEGHADIERMKKRVSEKKFMKSIKKRNID